MPRFHATRALAPRAALSAAVLGGILALPAAASASQSHVVVLKPVPEGTCERAISELTGQYAISPRLTYTSSICGFSASLQRKTVESLRLDPRVQSVTADTGFAVG